MYADDTTMSSCLIRKSDKRDKTNLVTVHVQWLTGARNYLLLLFFYFNASNMNLVSFNHHRQSFLVDIIVTDAKAEEISTLRILGSTVFTHMKWSGYIEQ